MENNQIDNKKKKYSNNDDIVKQAISNLNSIIIAKKLTFNGIWTSKITQEDPYIIQPLENSNENLILINILFNSILVFTKKINEKLILLLNPELGIEKINIYVKQVSIYLGNLVWKIKNFKEIKNKTFKLSKESLFEIKSIKDQFNHFDIQGGSKLITEISSFLGDFYEELKKHLAN